MKLALNLCVVINPYIKRILNLLGDQDPIQVLKMTPERLEYHLLSFSTADLARSYAPGKWSASDIFCHYADVEMVMGFRFRQVISTLRYAPEGFDQDVWAGRYGRLEPSLALDAFRGLRAWNMSLFASFDMEDWNKEVIYHFKGIETVDDMVRFLAGHDLNHLEQLEKIAQL